VGASQKAGDIHRKPNRKVESCCLYRYVVRDVSGTANSGFDAFDAVTKSG